MYESMKPTREQRDGDEKRQERERERRPWANKRKQSIKSLSEKLQNIRNTFSPPKKFSFKNRKKDTTVVPVTAAEQQQYPTATTHNQSTTTVATAATAATIPPAEPETSSALSHKSSARIILPPDARTTSSPTLSHLTHCVVNLSPCTQNGTTPFAALYLRDISHSLIICGQVAGAIHITDVSDSVIVTACRQFRMHASKNVHVYLHSASRPIFEDCDGLSFAPLPAIYVSCLDLDMLTLDPNQFTNPT